MKFLKYIYIVAVVLGSIFIVPTHVQAAPPTLTHVTSVTDDGSLLLDAPRSVKVQGNYAYVLSLSDKSITIFDISTPASPSKVGEIQDNTNLLNKRFLEVSGNYVYVGGTATGLIAAYDVSNKAAPVLADTLTLTNIFYDFEIQGSYLYAYGDTGTTCFTVVSISDPTNMVESAVASDATKCNGNLGGEVSGNYVYTMSTTGATEYLTIFNISTPTSPSQVGSFSFAGAGFSDANWQDAEYYNGYLYVTGWQSDVLLSINVSDPASPTFADSYTDGTLMDAGIYLERVGSYVVVVGYFGKTLLAFDVTDPTNLTLTTSLTDTTNLNNPYDFTISGDYIYVPSLTNDKFSIFSFDGSAPVLSLTAVSPDPTTDSTPSLSGTAVDTFSAVSIISFQVDSTSGSWSSCTAQDGAFSGLSEAFTCAIPALSDGQHTVYVRSVDVLGNTSTASSDTFTVDTTAPTMSGVASRHLTNTSVEITFTSNEATSTQVEYGLTSSLGTSTTESDTAARVTSHTTTLSSLTACTTYSFRVKGSDAAGQSGQSAIVTFITGGCPDPQQSTSSGAQIPQGSQSGDAGGVLSPIRDSYTANQPVSVIIEPGTLQYDAYLSAQVVTPDGAGTLIDPLAGTVSLKGSSSNVIQVGGSAGILGVKLSCGVSWQVGKIQRMWYKTHPTENITSSAHIIPELQKKLSIIALGYSATDLIPPGNRKSSFRPSRLKLAYSPTGTTWKILPTSVVDVENKTVAALDKVGGYYMIVSECMPSGSSASSVQGAFKKKTTRDKRTPAKTQGVKKVAPSPYVTK